MAFLLGRVPSAASVEQQADVNVTTFIMT